MKTAIVLPFTELQVSISEDPDPTCLIRIRGEKMSLCARRSIFSRTIKIKTKKGWESVTPRVVPVIEVVAKE